MNRECERRLATRFLSDQVKWLVVLEITKPYLAVGKYLVRLNQKLRNVYIVTIGDDEARV